MINSIGGLFYTTFLTGTHSVNTIEEAVEAAKEVVASLPNRERCIFMVSHQYSGERLIYGYFYADKAYGSILIYQSNNKQYRIDINNGEYIAR